MPSAQTQNPEPFSLDELEKRTFNWFWETAYPGNFQTPDRWPTEDFSSIAATGFGLAAYIVGAERGWVSRAQAAERTLNVLRVLKELPQGSEPTGKAGYRGFFYHFLEVKTATRFKNVELSSIDTGLLMAGVLTAMTYFDKNSPDENAIREIADFLFRRVEWDWYLNDNQRLSMGWHPERGFLAAEWHGYNEAMLLVLMAMGSPTHPIPEEAWPAWCKTYFRAEFKGQDMVNFGPLFGHQYSHVFIDFRGIKDDYCRRAGFDYFENSRRATLANRQHCIENPGKFKGYGENIWGLTACDGPFDGEKTFDGQSRWFQTYSARGVARDYLNDDGTITPTAAGGSLPFAPEVCLPALEALWNRFPVGKYGFYDAYNETFTDASAWQRGLPGQPFWVDRDYLGIDQGPLLLMIENYRTGLIWNVLRKNKYLISGLKKAGFSGGWLEKSEIQNMKLEAPLAEKPIATNPEIPISNGGFFRREIFVGSDGGQLPYQLSEPPTINRQPLVVFLHGSGERGSDNEKQMKNGVFAFVEKEIREKHPCYLLVPQCPEDERWGGVTRTWDKVAFNAETFSAPGKRVIELVEKLLRENPSIDPNRVYLAGLSMGGFGTFDLLMRRPELFAAGIPVCGGGDPDFAGRIKDIPLWVFHGALDEVVLPKFSRNIVEALKKEGSSVKYTEFSTKGHDVWEIVFYNPAVWEWLFAQRK